MTTLTVCCFGGMAGAKVGITEGANVGVGGREGAFDGVCVVGCTVGAGETVGGCVSEVGALVVVGDCEGRDVGDIVGVRVGVFVGAMVGGSVTGACVGLNVGFSVGLSEGDFVGGVVVMITDAGGTAGACVCRGAVTGSISTEPRSSAATREARKKTSANTTIAKPKGMILICEAISK